jgi:hypothetical protein
MIDELLKRCSACINVCIEKKPPAKMMQVADSEVGPTGLEPVTR